MTGVLVVEDQQVLASALETAIDTQPDLDCFGIAATVDDALAQIEVRLPDVVLMDIELPGMDGIEGTRLIKAAHPDVTVLVLTGGATSERLAEATTAGAGGFLAKDTSFRELLAAIRCPLPGKVVVEGTVLHDLIGRRLAKTPPSGGTGEETTEPPATGGTAPGEPIAGDERGLTSREFEVLGLMGQGLDPAAIAERLVVSVHTARGHVKNVMMKLGAHTQLEAVVIATRLGLLHVQAYEQSQASGPGKDEQS